jgi:membrane-bound lytic murein transglycosylase D
MKQFKFISALLVVLFISLVFHAKADNEDQLYAQRLNSLKSPIELTYNDAVRKHIDHYLSDPQKTADLLGKCQVIFPSMEKILRDNKLPIELKYLVVAASGANNEMVAPTGATGYWRMMYNVARTYGLKINSFLDERKDPVRSTQAAASYLKDLNGIYNNWQLSLAAYANTPAILNKSIRQSGYKMNYWDVYPTLPAETKEFIPEFIASAYIFNFFREHGITPHKHDLLMAYDTVTVNKWISFEQISSTLSIPVSDLRELNPIFKKDVVPLGVPPYVIKLPKGKVKNWGRLKDSSYNYVPRPVDMAPRITQKEEPKPEVKPEETTQKNTENTAEPEKEEEKKADKKETPAFNKKRINYAVKSGDVLGDIADWYDVTPAQIKSWNKLRSTKIRSGQKLIVWVPTPKFAYYSRINGMNRAQKKSLKKKD